MTPDVEEITRLRQELEDARLVLLFADGLAVEEITRLRQELEDARLVLLFADGLAVSNTGFALADLYSETFEPAQRALRAAGCHPRGRFRG